MTLVLSALWYLQLLGLLECFLNYLSTVLLSYLSISFVIFPASTCPPLLHICNTKQTSELSHTDFFILYLIVCRLYFFNFYKCISMRDYMS